VTSQIDDILPPCHPFNRGFGSSQECDILSQPYICFHHSRVDSGSGSILVVSAGNSGAYNNLRCVSFQLLGAYEETSCRYFTWLFHFDCMEYLWAFVEKLTGFNCPYYISDEIYARHQAAGSNLL
jgi:hypothetical protein